MKRRLPPLKALPAFEKAARHRSFSAAAQELHLTHGAISRQVKALETYLGVPLFRRFHRRIELTEGGATFLPAVQTAFDVLEKSAEQISALPQRGALVVSCLPTFMMRWLIPRLYDFNARHPDVEVRLSASYSPIDFRRDGIDVAIRFGTSPWPAGIDAHAFLEEQFGPVCAPGLVERRKLRRPSDLQRHVPLHTESRPDAWSEWCKKAGIAGVSVGTGLRFEHFYFLLEAAVGGLGVGVAPLPLVAEDIKIGRLIAPLGFVPSGRSYYILHPAELGDLPKVKAFLSWILGISTDHEANATRLTAKGQPASE